MKRFFYHLCVLTCFCTGAASPQIQNGKFVFQYEVVVLGFSANVFKHSDIADARALSSILFQEVLNNWSVNLSNRVVIYENLDSLRKDIRGGELDIIVLTTPEYLILKKQEKIIPFLAYKLSDRILDRILLITRKDSKIKSVYGLKGGKIAVYANRSDPFNLPGLWFTTLVLKNGGNDPRDFASSVYKVRRGTNAISDVFFRNADAAVVPEMELRISRELNPQIGKELCVIDSSKQMLYSLLCYTGKLTSALARYRDRDLHTASNMLCSTNNTEGGRHFLSIFRIASIVPFEASYLNDTETLFNDFRTLSADNRLK